MTPEEFISKWSRREGTERQTAQEHFIDLCRVLGEPTPNEADDPNAYSFEKGVSKIDGASGFADVWKRGAFGWEWETCKKEIEAILSRSRGRPGKAVLDRAEARLDVFLKRLDEVRVLDPACGSGNFLYLAMQSLKDLERRAIVETQAMGLYGLREIHCGPHNVKGIEINTYAAELARTSLWIGNIQWERRNGFERRREPVLENLQSIECRDALVKTKADGAYEEAQWPEAEFIVGNPPFLGGVKIRRGLTDSGYERLRELFSRVPATADYVTYWFEKAKNSIDVGRSRVAGLVATNSIRRWSAGHEVGNQ